MASPTSIPCIDKVKVDSYSSIDNTLTISKTTPQSPSSNPIPSPEFRDRSKVAIDNCRMLVCPTVMALQSQSRLRISRQGVVQPLQSQDGNESPSTKRSRVEEKDDAIPSLCANIRAISSNHDSSKLRNKYEDKNTFPKPAALSCENHDDTSHIIGSVTEREEISPHSSPARTNGGTTDRTVDRAQSSGLDADLICRNPPMKRAKVAIPDVDLIIRIPTSIETQITTTKQKPLTLTDTNHITKNNTSNQYSIKTGDKKNNFSLAALQVSAIAKSSLTESSTSSLSTTATSASAIATPSKVTGSENMSVEGKVVKNAQSPNASEGYKLTTALTPKETSQSLASSLITTTKEVIQPKKLTAEKTGKVSETIGAIKPKILANTVPKTIIKRQAESPKKVQRSNMSVIKNSPVQQAVSSNSFPANQVKTALTNVVEVNKNSNSVSSSSPPASPATKKKKTGSGNKRKRSGSGGSSSTQKSKGQSCGRWTQGEHQAFLEGLTECGREWKKVALRIPTRTSAQIRSHAQKYFAKLQRDQESSASNVNAGFVHGDLSSPLTPDGAGLVIGIGGLSGTVITSPGATPMAPSVRRNVERIVSNPRAAQREVEDTMEALRERYRQLQQRLEERRRNREDDKKSRDQKLEQSLPLSSASTNTGVSSEISAFASPPIIPQKLKQMNTASRKRMQLPTNTKKTDTSGRSSSIFTADDNSSVSSNVSSIAASRTDLVNEEIIALQVLGDSLPRSESVNDFHVLGAEVFQDSSIEVDGTMPSINDNISSSSYDQLAPLHGVGNDSDSLMNHESSVAENENNISTCGAATSGSLSVGGISAL